MKSEWESAASLQVYQLEADKEQYKVVGLSSGESDQRKTSHLIVPVAYARICVILVTITWPPSER